jgi:prevent-host-death family protein
MESGMTNTLTAAALKRRGMAAIEDALRHGPVHIVKRNKPAAVVLSEDEYRRLTGSQPGSIPGQTALQWLLTQPAVGTRDKADIDAALATSRDW